MRKEINWAKPVLVGGAKANYKLVGTLEDKQLVVLTDGPQAVQTLFAVYPDGSSVRMEVHPRYAETKFGPQFTNAPDEVIPPTFFVNIYRDDSIGWTYLDLDTAVRKAEESNGIYKCVATVQIKIKVDGCGNVSGSVSRA